jgi:hypothetical protein
MFARVRSFAFLEGFLTSAETNSFGTLETAENWSLKSDFWNEENAV